MMLDRIVEVFEVDDFCQAFVPQWEASLLGTGWPPPRGPQLDLPTSEIITLTRVKSRWILRMFYSAFRRRRVTAGSQVNHPRQRCWADLAGTDGGSAELHRRDESDLHRSRIEGR
jgi:hypothetical protein